MIQYSLLENKYPDTFESHESTGNFEIEIIYVSAVVPSLIST
jgi:hypothetical protein